MHFAVRYGEWVGGGGIFVKIKLLRHKGMQAIWIIIDVLISKQLLLLQWTFFFNWKMEAHFHTGLTCFQGPWLLPPLAWYIRV